MIIQEIIDLREERLKAGKLLYETHIMQSLLYPREEIAKALAQMHASKTPVFVTPAALRALKPRAKRRERSAEPHR